MTRGLYVERGPLGRAAEAGPFRGLTYAIAQAIGLQVLGARHVRVTRPSRVDLGRADGLTRDEREACEAAGLDT